MSRASTRVHSVTGTRRATRVRCAPTGVDALEGESGAESMGPIGDDLDHLFSEQMRAERVDAATTAQSPRKRPPPPVRQRGTLPGRLSPARYGLRLASPHVATELASDAGTSWAVTTHPPAFAWRFADARFCRNVLGPDCSPVSLAVGADGQVYVGDAWRGAFRLGAPDQRLRPLKLLDGVDAPVGPLWLTGSCHGEVWALDGLGALRLVSERGLAACPFDAGGRVYALAHDGTHLRLLVHDAAAERYRLRTPLADEKDLDLGPMRADLDLLPSLCAGPGGVVALGVAREPLLIAHGERRPRPLRDLEGAHCAVWLSDSNEVALAFAVRVADRDVIWLREGEHDAVALDLGEPLECDDGTVTAAPGVVHAMAANQQARTLYVATDVGIVALCLRETCLRENLCLGEGS